RANARFCERSRRGARQPAGHGTQRGRRACPEHWLRRAGEHTAGGRDAVHDAWRSGAGGDHRQVPRRGYPALFCGHLIGPPAAGVSPGTSAGGSDGRAGGVAALADGGGPGGGGAKEFGLLWADGVKGNGAGSAMHVLITTDTVGGVWNYTRELVTGLSRRGIRVTLVSFG